MTGESLPIEKFPDAHLPGKAQVDTPLDMPNLLFMGTNVVSGSAISERLPGNGVATGQGNRADYFDKFSIQVDGPAYCVSARVSGEFIRNGPDGLPRMPAGQWSQADMNTGAVIVRSMLRVTPPNAHSRKREWP